MDVALVADTHVPDREAAIPESFRTRIEAADHVVHAGDFTTTDTLAEVRDLAADLTAVHGNMDPDDIGLPTVASVDVGGVTVGVTHAHVNVSTDEVVESRADWLDAVLAGARAAAADPAVAVGAHSHVVEDEVVDGVRVLNPGSVTGADPAGVATMMTLAVADGEVTVTVHEA